MKQFTLAAAAIILITTSVLADVPGLWSFCLWSDDGDGRQRDRRSEKGTTAILRRSITNGGGFDVANYGK